MITHRKNSMRISTNTEKRKSSCIIMKKKEKEIGEQLAAKFPGNVQIQTHRGLVPDGNILDSALILGKSTGIRMPLNSYSRYSRSAHNGVSKYFEYIFYPIDLVLVICSGGICACAYY